VLIAVDGIEAGPAAVPHAQPAAPSSRGAGRGTGLEVVDVRRCACGCETSMVGRRPNASYATDACRSRAWKQRNRYVDQRAGKPSRNANGAPRRAPTLRVSYRKAVQAVESELAALGHPTPAARARVVLMALLSARARRFA
jgi:hypothetical protein